MIQTFFLLKKDLLRITTFLSFTLLFSGCAHLIHLDQAQDAFSKGAEKENAALFNPSTISSASPEAYYTLAYAEASKALEKEGKLKSANVLGTTYSIKAMAAWKLRKYGEARQLAKTAKRNLSSGDLDQGVDVNYTRDYAVMEAMDALIAVQSNNDSVFQLMSINLNLSADAALDLYKTIIHNHKDSTGRIITAIHQLDQIIASVSKKHEVRTYFNMSQLAGLKVWSDAISNLKFHLQANNAYNANKTWYENEETLFLKLKDDYINNLAQKLPNGMSDPVYIYWKFIL